MLWWNDLATRLDGAAVSTGNTLFADASESAKVFRDKLKPPNQPSMGDDFEADFETVTRVARKWLDRLGGG